MNIQTLKHPPHATEPEQMILGGMMTHQDTAIQVFGKLSPDDFYRSDHRTIAQTIQTLHAKHQPHDYIAVTEALRSGGQLDEAGGAVYLAQLSFDCYSVANIEGHAELVREKSLQRRIIALCQTASEEAFSAKSADVISRLSDGVEAITKQVASPARKFTELFSDMESHFDLAKQRRSAGGVLGAPTGLPALDRMMGGIYGQRLYGIAARPATGKTALLNQIAIHAAQHDQPGLIISLEMGASELMIRAAASLSGQNVSQLFHGHHGPCEFAVDAVVRCGDLPLWVDTDTYSLSAIVAQIAAHKHRYGITWAAVDHIGLIETPKFNTRNDQIGHITRTLKQASKRINIPIIALCQLNRSNERDGRRPGLHDLRDSGNIEQDLDVAMFLHVDKDARDANTKQVHIGLLKNRSGPAAWISEVFQFDGAKQTFTEIAR